MQYYAFELDDESKAAEEEDDDDDKDDEGSEDEDVEEKVARHKAKWQKRMKKYQKYANKGKVEKLQKANAKQQAKLQKAIDHGKPQLYIDYKRAKCDYTANMIKTATLIQNLQKSGFM